MTSQATRRPWRRRGQRRRKYSAWSYSFSQRQQPRTDLEVGAPGRLEADAEAQTSALEEEPRNASQSGEVLEIADREHGQVAHPGEQLRGLTARHARNVEHVARTLRRARRQECHAHAMAGDQAACGGPLD